MRSVLLSRTSRTVCARPVVFVGEPKVSLLPVPTRPARRRSPFEFSILALTLAATKNRRAHFTKYKYARGPSLNPYIYKECSRVPALGLPRMFPSSRSGMRSQNTVTISTPPRYPNRTPPDAAAELASPPASLQHTTFTRVAPPVTPATARAHAARHDDLQCP